MNLSFRAWSFALAIAAGASGAAAADYPAKPINLIVNFGAGSTTDIVARMVAERTAKELGGTIVVLNRAGAGGSLGIAQVARSAPDGYTIGTANMPALAILPQTQGVQYDPDKDLVQIASVLPYEYITIARADAPYKTWNDLVRYVKQNPGKVTYGGLGRGTTDHITMERMARDLDLQWRYIPFKGSTDMVAALIGGHVDLINSTVGPVASYISAGKLNPLLVTSEDRFPELAPNAPTMKEAGFDHSQVSYMSIVAPAGIPAPVRDKLEAAFKVAVEDPDLIEKTRKLHFNLAFIPGAAYDAKLKTLRREFAPILGQLGLRQGN
jgi:tripartite-type tricarboxylate transporter receptor subunit TctC